MGNFMIGDTRKITSEELEQMPPEEQRSIWQKAIKIEGTAVVRRADGSIKYDDPQEATDGTDTGNSTSE